MSEMEKQDITQLPSKTSSQLHNTDGMLGFNGTDGGFQVTLENLSQYIAGDAKEFIPPTHGTAGQLLRSTGDGGSEWGDAASPEEIAEAVTDWLDENVPTGETLVVDESLTIEGAAADSKVTGEKITAVEESIADLRKEMFSAPIEYTGITVDSSWITGSGVDSQTGGNVSDSDYCRTGFIKIESITYIHLDSETYDFNVWEYTSNSTSSAIFAPKKAYNGEDAFVTFDQNATYFRIGARRKDLAHIQSSDITALTSAIKTYATTDPTLSISGAVADAKVVGNKVTALEDGSTINEIIVDIPDWELGAISGSGNELNGDTYLTYWLRSGFYPASRLAYVKATCLSGFGTDLQIYCCQYDATKTWIGYVVREIPNGESSYPLWRLDTNCAYIRFTASHFPRSTTPMSILTDPQYIQVSVKSRLYSEVSKNYGKDIIGLKSLNTVNLLYEDEIYWGAVVTRNGVTFASNDDGSISLFGESTSSTIFDFFNKSHATNLIPSWLVLGKEYRVKYSGENVYFRVLYHDGTQWNTVLDTLHTNGVFTIPTGATGVILRLGIKASVTVNETVFPIIYEGPLKEDIDQKVDIFGGDFSKYYNSFINGSIVYNDTTQTIKLDASLYSNARRTVLVNLEKPIRLSLTDTDYIFRLYFYDDDGLIANTAWSNIWEIPSGKTVAITIRRADNTVMAADEKPQLSLVVLDDIPKSYYLSEIENVVARVKAVNTEPGLCFLLSTDQHTMSVYNTLLKYDTISDMVTNMKSVARKINFDGNISLGDISDFKVGTAEHFSAYGINDNTNYANLDEVFYHWMDYAIDELASVHQNLIYVPGNHDDNRYINKDVLHETTSAYDYSPGEMYSYYTQRSQLRRVPNVSNHGLDYYIDYPDHKIRMICMHSNHYYENTASPSGYYKCWWYGFADETVPWLESTLNSVPEDYSVLVCSHMSSVKEHNADDVSYINMDNIKSTIQAFINNGGNYIATLYGHSHVDWEAMDPWPEITFCCQKCYNRTPDYPNMPGSVQPLRTANTATEDCWNIVLVQPISETVRVIRFGAGNDRIIHYKLKNVTNSLSLTTELTGTVTWATSDDLVATVSNGVVAAVSSGTAKITVTNENGDSEIWGVTVA